MRGLSSYLLNETVFVSFCSNCFFDLVNFGFLLVCLTFHGNTNSAFSIVCFASKKELFLFAPITEQTSPLSLHYTSRTKVTFIITITITQATTITSHTKHII